MPLVGAPVDPAGAQQTEVVAVTGDPTPSGNGTFESFIYGESTIGPFGAPVLNDAGQLTFGASLAGTANGDDDDSGLYSFDGDAIEEIVREGDVPPDGDGVFSLFRTDTAPALDDGGDRAWMGFIRKSQSGELFETAVYLTDDAGTIQLARAGDPAPPGGDTFQHLFPPRLNGSGSVAFTCVLEAPDPVGERAIYRLDAVTGARTRIVRAHESTPDGTASYDLVGAPALNEAGQVAFRTSLFSPIVSDNGAYRADGASVIEIARRFDPIPGSADETISFVHRLDIDDAGRVAFAAVFTDSFGKEPPSGEGILVHDGGESSVVLRSGDPAPDGNGVFARFQHPLDLERTPDLNNAGQIATYAQLAETSGGGELGFFRADELGREVVQIARRGDEAPDGNGVLGLTFVDDLGDERYGHIWLNDRGQAAFFSNLLGTSGGAADDTGIFFWDDHRGLLQVAREGEPMLGSTVVRVSLLTRLGQPPGNDRSGLNDRGEVAFAFGLLDGREGIAVWSVEEELFSDGFESGGTGAWGVVVGG